MNLPAIDMIHTRLSQQEIIPVLVNQKRLVPHLLNPRSETGPVRVPGEGKRIFVIDDESIIADSLTEILNSNGYEAVAFYDGRSAVEAARNQCPDFVVADVVMPRLNGIETAIAIRKFCLGVRIVLFSGQAGTTDLLDVARARGYSFELLAKPIHPDRLLKKLATLRSPQ